MREVRCEHPWRDAVGLWRVSCGGPLAVQAVKEFPWRNGYFWGLSQKAATEGQADPCPKHSALLRELKAV